jgi:hypothetical protein
MLKDTLAVAFRMLLERVLREIDVESINLLTANIA